MNPHRASLSRQPLAQLAVAFSGGILAASYFNVGFKVWGIAGVLCTAATLVCVVRQWLTVAGVALLLAVTCAGAALAIQEQRDQRHDGLRRFSGRQVILTGVLSGPVEFSRDRMYLTLSAEQMEVDGSAEETSGVASLLATFRTAESEQEYRDL
ncbi:MAG TPA: DUF4131 domain-containing protein, partial [Pyrinomonadaceae bacterium]